MKKVLKKSKKRWIVSALMISGLALGGVVALNDNSPQTVAYAADDESSTEIIDMLVDGIESAPAEENAEAWKSLGNGSGDIAKAIIQYGMGNSLDKVIDIFKVYAKNHEINDLAKVIYHVTVKIDDSGNASLSDTAPMATNLIINSGLHQKDVAKLLNYHDKNLANGKVYAQFLANTIGQGIKKYPQNTNAWGGVLHKVMKNLVVDFSDPNPNNVQPSDYIMGLGTYLDQTVALIEGADLNSSQLAEVLQTGLLGNVANIVNGGKFGSWEDIRTGLTGEVVHRLLSEGLSVQTLGEAFNFLINPMSDEQAKEVGTIFAYMATHVATNSEILGAMDVDKAITLVNNTSFAPEVNSALANLDTGLLQTLFFDSDLSTATGATLSNYIKTIDDLSSFISDTALKLDPVKAGKFISYYVDGTNVPGAKGAKGAIIGSAADVGRVIRNITNITDPADVGAISEAIGITDPLDIYAVISDALATSKVTSDPTVAASVGQAMKAAKDSWSNADLGTILGSSGFKFDANSVVKGSDTFATIATQLGTLLSNADVDYISGNYSSITDNTANLLRTVLGYNSADRYTTTTGKNQYADALTAVEKFTMALNGNTNADSHATGLVGTVSGSTFTAGYLYITFTIAD